MDKYAPWAQQAAQTLYAQYGTWAAVAAELAPYLRLSGTTWRRVAQGKHVTRERIDALRLQAGLRPLPTLRLIESCPTCDGDHGLTQIPDCAPKPKLPSKDTRITIHVYPDPALRIAKLTALLRQAEAELSEAA
jgi:hypothetical protein